MIKAEEYATPMSHLEAAEDIDDCPMLGDVDEGVLILVMHNRNRSSVDGRGAAPSCERVTVGLCTSRWRQATAGYPHGVRPCGL